MGCRASSSHHRSRRRRESTRAAWRVRGSSPTSRENGASFGQRVSRFYGTAGFRSWRAGENLLWASPDIDAKRAVEMWLESPGHRRILLTPAWREIGLSAVHTASAPRAFDGLEVTIVTADFGARVR